MSAASNSGGGGSGSSSSGEKTIALVSSDNSVRFEAREAAALLSQTVRRMIDEAGADASDGIPLPNVDARTLAKVLEYCDKHAPASSSSSAADQAAPPPAEGLDLEHFDREFMRVDNGTIFSLANAAHYLKIEGLVKLTCETIADMIKGKTTEQIRKIFGIENEFTPEEEDQVRRENSWAF